MVANLEATIEDLYRVPGKAEIVNGEIVHMSPTGAAPNYAASEIFVSLREYSKRTKRGYAISDNAAFHVDPLGLGLCLFGFRLPNFPNHGDASALKVRRGRHAPS